MNPAVQTKSSDSFKFKAKEDNWKTTSGKQLGNNWNAIEKKWGLELLGADNWTVWGLSGRQLGKNPEITSGTKSEIIGRPHLQDKRETTR